MRESLTSGLLSNSILESTSSGWITEHEVLTRLKICKRTLWVWHHKKGLPKYQVGWSTFYKVTDLNNLFEKNKKVARKNKSKLKSKREKKYTHE